MKIVKTAKSKITTHVKSFEHTSKIYEEAVSFFINVCEKEYKNLCSFSGKDRLTFIESTTHKTKNRKSVKYDFSVDFYKVPSYFRRAAINEAIGVVDSHFSRLKIYEDKKRRKLIKNKKFYEKPPKLNYKPKTFPTFYKKEMIKTQITDDKNVKSFKAQIKLFVNNDWIWVDIEHNSNAFFSSGEFRFDNFKIQNPKLVKKGKKYFLHFPFETKVSLKSTPIEQQKIVAVDLGLTNSAVVSCMDYSGTVLDRLFINQSSEKDQLKHTINKLSKANRESSIECSKPNYWRKINNLQQYIVQNTADSIVEFAIKNNADVIVFEHLGKFKSPKGFYGAKKLRSKLQFWAKSKIQKTVKLKAWSLGIRFSKVLARGTSMYAFDGSGLVIRNGKKDIAKFANNKEYHADLSASYNIGARYFIREILKPLSETTRSSYEAKVPHLKDRSRHTLSSLISLHTVINHVEYADVFCIQDTEVPSIADSSV